MAGFESMTVQELEALIAETKGGEWEQIGFKKTTGELQGGMETLCGFLNGSGGKVLFGVNNAGKIVGQETGDSTFQDIANAIRKIEPSVWIEQIRVKVDSKREVIVLATSVHQDAPYCFDGRAYQRIGNTTSRMPQTEFERRIFERRHAEHRWEDRPATRYSLDSVDSQVIDRVLDEALQCGRIEHKPTSFADALAKFKLSAEGCLKKAGVVLFATDVIPDFPQCGLRMARFSGVSKLGDFIDQRQFHGHAFRLLDEAELFLRRHIPVGGTFVENKLQRQDRPAYPYLALREALVNAICHRDYSIVGGAVHVAIFDDRVEIISSGLLPAGISIDDLKRDHASLPRNPTIAEVFFRCGLIEKWGRGTQKIVESCLDGGYPEPQFTEQAGNFIVSFPSGSYVPPTRVGRDLTDRQRKILKILSGKNEWTFPEFYAASDKTLSERTVRSELRLLYELGLVGSRGRGKFARWWLIVPDG